MLFLFFSFPQFNLSETQYRLHAKEVANSLDLSKYDGIVCVSGDGILVEVGSCYNMHYVLYCFNVENDKFFMYKKSCENDKYIERHQLVVETTPKEWIMMLPTSLSKGNFKI